MYVQPYPGPGEKTRISTGGGTEPIWTASGGELLYRHLTRSSQEFSAAFSSATIRSLSPFRADTPRVLFEATAGEYPSTTPVREWDVSADGQRFFLLRSAASTDKPATEMHVVLTLDRRTESASRRRITDEDQAQKLNPSAPG